MEAACWRSCSDRPRDVRILLDKAADWFHERITALPTRTILSVLSSQSESNCSVRNHVELFAAFDRHILELTKMFHGPQHSITRLLAYMLQLGHEEAMIDMVYQNVLKMHVTGLRCQQSSKVGRSIRRLARVFQSSGHYQEAETILLHEVETCEPRSLSDNYQFMRASFELALHYIRNRSEKDNEAERILHEIWTASTEPTTGQTEPRSAYFVAGGLSELAMKNGNTEASLHWSRLQIQAAVEWWGKDHLNTLHAVDNLTEELRKEGRAKPNDETERPGSIFEQTVSQDSLSRRDLRRRCSSKHQYEVVRLSTSGFLSRLFRGITLTHLNPLLV